MGSRRKDLAAVDLILICSFVCFETERSTGTHGLTHGSNTQKSEKCDFFSPFWSLFTINTAMIFVCVSLAGLEATLRRVERRICDEVESSGLQVLL